MNRSILAVFLSIMLISQYAFSQTMTIHTKGATNQFNLADIDSITFAVSDGRDGNAMPGHEITTDETWSGDILLKGDIKIARGVTLTIMPGTRIKAVTANLDWDGGFKAGKVDIYSYGKIIAEGTKDNLVVFTVDSQSPKMEDWWGIGMSSGSSATFKYCCFAYSMYGLFVFSTNSSSPAIQNCMFAYTGGVSDFGPDAYYSYNTFINGDYGYERWEEGKTALLSQCVFKKNSMIDIQAVDSNNQVMVDDSNFLENDWYNLYISDSFSPVNVLIAANNCYGIVETEDNGCGTITVENPAGAPIATAGCGFDMPVSSFDATLSKGTVPSRKDILRDTELKKFYNEKDKKLNR